MSLSAEPPKTVYAATAPPHASDLIDNGDAKKSESGVGLSVLVKSRDGQLHNLIYNGKERTIEFSLADKPKHRIVVKLDEVLCVRSSRVRLYGGFPKEVDEDAPDPERPNVLYLYYANKRNVFIWRAREAELVFLTTADKKKWQDILQTALKELRMRAENILVFINPYGGKGTAKKIYKKDVQPMFKLAGLTTQVKMTERANHAYDFLREMDAADWETIDGVVSVGGDGLFNEVLCSVVIRTQVENNKDIADLSVESLTTPRIRFGIIGAGSANSIVSSVHGTDDPRTAATQIAIGSKCAVDVCTIHEGGNLLRISANAISYGWLGDVLRDSEHYRFMGPIRYQYSALRTTARNPSYYGRVSFALSSKPQDKDMQLPLCKKPCTICDGSEPIDPNLPYHWQTDFSHMICCVIPCVSPFTPWGLAPYTGLGDGTMDLALVEKLSRCANLNVMRTVALKGGKGLLPAENHNCHIYRVKHWSFKPAGLLNAPAAVTTQDVEADSPRDKESVTEAAAATASGKDKATPTQGCYNIDGEILPQPEDKVLSFRLHPQLITYFGRELDLDDPRYSRCYCCHSPKQLSKIIILG